MTRGDFLPLGAPLEAYGAQARQLLDGHRAGDRTAIEVFHNNHPRFLDDEVRWLPRPVSDAEIGASELTMDDARLAVARAYSFADWGALTSLFTAAASPGSPVREFELASEAVITGDVATLRRMVAAHTDLVHARSTRVTPHDPPQHRATLLHYLGANGVEGYRQRSAPNAVEVARLLLDNGAAVDALAGMYGGEYPTLSMLISSTPPAEAGVQVPLVHTLLDYGAAVEGTGSPQWQSPLMTALVFGFREAADAMVARGAQVSTLEAAAGLGRLDACKALLSAASAESRHKALALASMLGNTDVVRLLLDAGEDPNRLNPDGFHSHATPLHHAANAGRMAVVELLVEHGARLDIEDTLWHGTPLGWARHGEQTAVAAYLEGKGSRHN